MTFKKRITAVLLALTISLQSIPVFADEAVGDPNIDNGGGGLGAGTHENGWYPLDDGVRITLVDAESGEIKSVSIDYTNKHPDDIQIHFGKVPKTSYLNGTSLTPTNSPYTYKVPTEPLPVIVSDGSNYFPSIDSIRSYLPGKKGKISVKYSNDEGPYPFDKTLTVYISSIKKPVLLKIRGSSVESVQKLEESYPEHIGPLAFKQLELNCGYMDQGGMKSEAALVANLSDKPMEVTFKDISENLKISVSPNPIPARSTAEISFSVTADRQLWGKNKYCAVPVANGKTYGNKKICVSAFTRENFEKLSDAERSNGPRPQFKESTFQAGKIKKGEIIHAQFTFENIGKKPFGVYKVDIDAAKWAHGRISQTQPGESTTFNVDVNTSNMPEGEMLVIVTLTTNSPLRPIVNLFITGWIE